MDTRPRRRPRLVATAAALLVVALAAATAQAGERGGTDLFAGYSFARVAGADRHGGSVAVSFGVAGPLRAFADASGHRSRSGGLDRDDLRLMAGPGVRFRLASGAVVFVRALAGVVRDSAGVSVLDVRISESSTRFGVMGGGGVDLRLTDHWSARAEGDYLWHDAAEGTRSGFRAGAGAAYRFGGGR